MPFRPRRRRPAPPPTPEGCLLLRNDRTREVDVVPADMMNRIAQQRMLWVAEGYDYRQDPSYWWHKRYRLKPPPGER